MGAAKPINTYNSVPCTWRSVEAGSNGRRLLFKVPIDQKEMNDIRSVWQTGTLLENDYVRKKIEAKLKCKVGQARRVRPLKGSDPL
jgi:hypothetical protein